MNEWKNKKVLVAGLGDTGLAMCEFLLKRGARVSVSDSKGANDFDIERLKKEKIAFEFGAHTEKIFLSQDMIVVSPGVPLNIPPIVSARAKGIPITNETEIAFGISQGKKIIAVTGTNGKSTTCALTHHILKSAKMKSVLAGNIGYPWIGAAEENQESEIFVIEVSSYQLELVEKFHANFATILNITPDHLERHGSEAEYRKIKERIFLNQTAEDLALINSDEAGQVVLAKKLSSRVQYFGFGEIWGAGAFVRNDTIFISTEDGGKIEELISLSETRLKGRHNLQNAMASALAARDAGVSLDVMRKAIGAFSGLPHVLQFVDEVAGVSFYDNSKATNVDAAVKSLEAFEDGRVALILGGRDKGGDYAPLIDAAKKKVKRLVIMGENKELLKKLFNGVVTDTIVCDSIEEAVVRGTAGLAKGDAVLLAPAAASFDMFRNYKERGDAFARAVRNLKANLGYEIRRENNNVATHIR